MPEPLSPSVLAAWRRSPVSFIEAVLVDPESRKPFVLLPAERAFLAYAFRLDDDGRLLFPEQVYSCPKKSGKTTFAALHVLTLVLLFGGAYPEATLCANDQEQARGRVYEMVKRIIEASPVLKGEAKLTESKITFPAFNATISAIASDAAGAAGGNQCISVFDELWAISTERSRRLFDELIPPPTRKIACRLTVTYAGFSGESLLLEELYKRGKALPQVGPSLHAGDGLLMFWSHEPVAPWQDEKWLAEMRRSLRPSAYARMVTNEFVAAEAQFVDLSAWGPVCNPRSAAAARGQVARGLGRGRCFGEARLDGAGRVRVLQAVEGCAAHCAPRVQPESWRPDRFRGDDRADHPRLARSVLAAEGLL
jgi:hypothetical protein